MCIYNINAHSPFSFSILVISVRLCFSYSRDRLLHVIKIAFNKFMNVDINILVIVFFLLPQGTLIES